jgi:hypothetical protein
VNEEIGTLESFYSKFKQNFPQKLEDISHRRRQGFIHGGAHLCVRSDQF